LKSYTSAELLAKASEPSSLTETFYYQLGVAQERSGSFEDAERTFRKCLQMAPEDAETLNYLGYSWADRGVNLEEARALIEKAVKLKPEEPAYLDSLAWVLYKLKQPQAALVPMEKAVRLSDKTPDATLFDHLGDIRAASGDAAGAREAWRKALELEPSDALRRKLEVAPATGKP
jgi:Flp pilus assembly protein TadD